VVERLVLSAALSNAAQCKLQEEALAGTVLDRVAGAGLPILAKATQADSGCIVSMQLQCAVVKRPEVLQNAACPYPRNVATGSTSLIRPFLANSLKVVDQNGTTSIGPG
jgi:hypothetical protein